jgi:superfamily II DNA or RNA helicase
MVQALVKPDTVDDAVAGYGQVIVDECHHASAVSFERVLAEVRARFIVGLTATPQRRDGQQAIMRMHRLHPGKKEVRVFDYVDRAVPKLRRMFEKRLRGYRAIGYAESEVPEGFELLSEQWPADWDGIEDEG